MSTDYVHHSFAWYGRLPSRGVGIERIAMTLELMLHVRMDSPEVYERLIPVVRQLSMQSAELLAELVEGADGDDVEYEGAKKVIRGDAASVCHGARRAHGRWEDLLFVLAEHGAVEPTAEEQERWDESIAEQRPAREAFERGMREFDAQQERPEP